MKPAINVFKSHRIKDRSLSKLTEDDYEECYRVDFQIGVQSFRIDYDGTKEEAQWMAEMLHKAFEKLKGLK